jgi:hypothetical protein
MKSLILQIGLYEIDIGDAMAVREQSFDEQ